jgi:uncharacterized protein YcbK (DUF882 family)
VSVAYITEHFTWQEFHCHDGDEVPLELQPNVRRLCVNVLEPLRARFGGPLVVISGYRSPIYNEALRRAGGGAAEHSRHMTGEAADVRPAELEALPRLRALVETMLTQGELPALGGFGIYPAWVHLDVRERVPAGHVARWFGRGVGSET